MCPLSGICGGKRIGLAGAWARLGACLEQAIVTSRDGDTQQVLVECLECIPYGLVQLVRCARVIGQEVPLVLTPPTCAVGTSRGPCLPASCPMSGVSSRTGLRGHEGADMPLDRVGQVCGGHDEEEFQRVPHPEGTRCQESTQSAQEVHRCAQEARQSGRGESSVDRSLGLGLRLDKLSLCRPVLSLPVDK